MLILHDTGAQQTGEDDLDLLRHLESDHDFDWYGEHEDVGEDRESRGYQVLHRLVVTVARSGSVPVLLNRHASEYGGEENRNQEADVGPVEDLNRASEPSLESTKSEKEEENRRLDQG